MNVLTRPSASRRRAFARDADGFGAQAMSSLTLEWPPKGDAPTPALAAMSAGKAVVAFETEETADWPALNPQTWKPRDFPGVGGHPIIVSIDPRDEEHSLKLAMRRLSTDAALRQQLGDAAREWWTTHATVGHAVKAWEAIIAEALTLPPLAPRLTPDDGSGRAREILSEFGVTVDLFSHEEHERNEAQKVLCVFVAMLRVLRGLFPRVAGSVVSLVSSTGMPIEK